MERCLTYDYIAVDTEGYAPNILGISIANPALDSMYFPIGHREDINLDPETKTYLFEVLAKVSFRIFHNAGHDLVALPSLFDLPFFDTMIGGHMVDENVVSKSLDWMCKHYDVDEGKQMHPLMRSIIDSWGWEWVPYALMYGYATHDALIDMKLFLKLLPMFEEQFGELWTPSTPSLLSV